jgi:hypothetical protein
MLLSGECVSLPTYTATPLITQYVPKRFASTGEPAGSDYIG